MQFGRSQTYRIQWFEIENHDMRFVDGDRPDDRWFTMCAMLKLNAASIFKAMSSCTSARRTRRSLRMPPPAGCQRGGRLLWFLPACALLALAIGCRTVPPFPPADLSQPGWTVRQGQAVWTRQRDAPELAGEILVASRPDGRAFVQFSKNPFPLVIAQSTATSWQVETPTDNKRHSGLGDPPARLIFLWLPRALAGRPLPRNWSWQKVENHGWRLENRAKGESLEAFLDE